MNVQKLKDALRSGIVEVEFVKADGSKRVMNATLQETFLPERTETIFQSSRAPNEDVCVVWDTEKKDFRSFRYDSVLNWTAWVG